MQLARTHGYKWGERGPGLAVLPSAPPHHHHHDFPPLLPCRVSAADRESSMNIYL